MKLARLSSIGSEKPRCFHYKKNVQLPLHDYGDHASWANQVLVSAFYSEQCFCAQFQLDDFMHD